MECKNCHTNIPEDSNFCKNCGGKVVSETLSLKYLFFNFIQIYIGWDNRYLQTLIYMALKPEILLKDYLDGVRRRYVDPFVFLAIGAAVSLLVFNSYLDQYIETQSSYIEVQIEMMERFMPNKDTPEFQQEMNNMRNEFRNNLISFLKYFNIFTFLSLPIYALISFLVFRKQYRYGEHLVINSYIQGFTFLVSTLFFIASIYISSSIFPYSFVFVIFYYLYVFGRLLDYSLARIALKLLTFLLVMVVFSIIFIIIVLAIAILSAIISKTFIG